MKPWPRVDFKELVQGVRQPQWGAADLSIWGGRCAEGNLLAFVQQWPINQMPYRIWEYASEIAFERDALPQTVALLERARLFGEGGDLELRREGAEFAWRFIGPASVQPPIGNGGQDYWADHPGETFYQREETALLWGKRNGSRWHDDRVGAARLEYPVPAEWSRLQIHYKTFSRAGQVEFAWFSGLSEWKEDDNG